MKEPCIAAGHTAKLQPPRPTPHTLKTEFTTHIPDKIHPHSPPSLPHVHTHQPQHLTPPTTSALPRPPRPSPHTISHPFISPLIHIHPLSMPLSILVPTIYTRSIYSIPGPYPSPIQLLSIPANIHPPRSQSPYLPYLKFIIRHPLSSNFQSFLPISSPFYPI